MILADKIMELRKKNGWSQEELASQMGVSRQAVSKWESAASIPDLDKILRLSQLFGVSTDYLLKESVEPEKVDEMAAEAWEYEETVRTVPLEEANTYLDTVRATAGKIALGVSLCILSPTVLILLGALSDEEGNRVIPEIAAGGIGITVLLVLVAVAVSLFIFFGKRLEPYEYMEKEPLELAYGVSGIVEKRKKKYETTHGMFLVLGVALCILSIIPIFVGAMLDEEGMAPVMGLEFCLALVALGVYLLVRTCMIAGSFQRLLEEGEYTREKKQEEKRNDTLDTIYWCVVTALYLAWSFYTMEWHRTWILWPCAGVLFGAVRGISALMHKNRK